MAEDWRVAFTLRPEAPGRIAQALQGLHERALEHDAAERLGGRIAVSRDDEHLFLYADSEPAAREARTVVSALLDEHDLAAEEEPAIERWHPVEQRWEDASVALPATAAELSEEHERREADEAAEAEESGFATWRSASSLRRTRTLRRSPTGSSATACPSCAGRRSCSSAPTTRTRRAALALWLHDELPPGAQILVEAGGNEIYEVAGNNRSAFLGGLAG